MQIATELIRLRVEPQHKRLMTSAARSVGLSLSAWLRQIALREAKAADV